jgi:hypothetical protein
MKGSIKSFAKKASNLYESVHQQLSVYAVAVAVVVVVSVLALTQLSEAKIDYTPVHVAIRVDYNLDLNHDGVTDFNIQNLSLWNGNCNVRDSVIEQPTSGNGVVNSE